MAPRFGRGEFQYELVEGWGVLPAGWELRQVAGVACDSRDHVHLFHRGMHPVIEFTPAGDVVRGWGDGLLAEAHGLHIDRADNLYLVDRGAHTIEKYSPYGTRTLRIGERFQSSPKHSDRPFNLPQGVAVAPAGDIYVADGKYNNAVHRFSADGAHLQSWGGHGSGPGQFDEPHGAWVLPDGEVMIADRGNDRIQFFTPDGRFTRAWTNIEHPDHLYVSPDGTVYLTEIDSQSVVILDADGRELCRWGGHNSYEPGLFWGAHGIWADSRGDLYVSEVQRGRRVQKFRRV